MAARHEWLGEPTLADAILDRIVHGAHKIGKTLKVFPRRGACPRVWPYFKPRQRARKPRLPLPEETPINELVSVAHQRWRIERDYQDLKQDFGLGHYEGRGWRGFHHHAALSIAAYGFLMAERLVADKSVGGKKNFAARQVPALPKDYVPRGSPARPTARGDLDHDTAPAPELSADRPARAMSMLRQGKHKATLVTQ